MRSKILYLDRDGIINKHIPYVGTFNRFHLIYEIFTLSKIFQKKGYQIIVVTNQSGIERGFYSLYDFFKLTHYMINEFKKQNIDIVVRACPHHPESNCFCRKPKSFMLNDNRSKEDIMIGDQDSDMLAAKRAGIINRWLISNNIKSLHATKCFLSHKDLISSLIKK